MLTIAYYFLQVIICSGVMTAYYWLALRNTRFHRYNRFYLMAAAVLPWFVPLVKIRMAAPAAAAPAQRAVTYLFSVVADNNSYMEQAVSQKGFQVNWNIVALTIYLLVAALFVTVFLSGLWKLYRLLKKEPVQRSGPVWVVFTEAKGTPFSFFRFIFWSRSVSMETGTGQRMMEHELAHVREKHTIDKLLLQVVISAGWFNPFFWLIRREMHLIHEFIADQKAVGDGDTAALAAMLLTAAYPRQQFAFTNPFFFSPIRRRIYMLTNYRSPRFSYWRRVIALPLAALIVLLFGFRKKEHNPYTVFRNFVYAQTAGHNYPALPAAAVADTIIRSNSARIVQKGDKAAQVIISSGNKKDTISLQADEITVTNLVRGSAGALPRQDTPVRKSLHDVLFILNGKKYTDSIKNIDPSDIVSVNVLKDSSAIAKYGAEAKNGVVEIYTKGRPPENEILVYTSVLMPKNRYGNTFRLGSPANTQVKFEVFDRFNSLVYRSTDYHNDWDGTDNQKSTASSLPDGTYFYMISATDNASGKQKAATRGYLTVLNQVQSQHEASGDASGGTQHTGDAREKAGTTGGGSGILFTSVELEPEFPGGRLEWVKYLYRNLNSMITVNNAAPSGKYIVDVSFTVDRAGKISSVKVENDPGYGTAADAVRVIRNSPDWIPAKQNGQRVAALRHEQITYSNMLNGVPFVQALAPKN